MGVITLLTGGVKSGKSAKALELCRPYAQKAFIATAEPFDDGMRQRIARHRAERDASFTTIEEPLNLARALHQADASNAGVIVVDCLTLWLNNLLYHRGITGSDADEIRAFLTALPRLRADAVIVTNETNMGIMPIHKETRLYGDLLGALNQQTAALAHKVLFMVCGLPLSLK